MSFNTALSGLRAASQDLAVTGNNIANASTTGFKQSRTEFADIYANSILGTGRKSAGNGVLVSNIAQQFAQGNISPTDNSLDMAIDGGGYFILNNGGSQAYTRAGAFGLDKEGYVIANNGGRLQGFGVNQSHQVVSGALTDLRIESQILAPSATTSVDLRFNLDSRVEVPSTTPFDVHDANSYNWSTGVPVFDSLGNPHTVTLYFAKTSDPILDADNNPVEGTRWEVYSDLNHSGVTQSLGQLDFDASGALMAPTPAALSGTWGTPGGADDLDLTLHLQGSTQHGAEFVPSSLHSDGFPPGRLAGVDINERGIMFARYTNGQAQALGQVALADFANPQGLAPIGDTAWTETFDSGQPVVGVPQSASLGGIKASALEDSNVDLSDQLVNLIIAQRNFQASAKTIETQDTITQAVLNLR